MKVLVTGASGFVGSILCGELLSRGHDVSAAVRRSGSAPSGTKEILVGDIDASTDWSHALEGQDAVIHLAARVHVMIESATDPLAEFRRINTAGTRRLAAESKSSGIEKFIFLSSIKANGEATDSKPFTVNDAPHPEDPYGVSKLEAEQAIESIAEGAGTQFSIIRTPLVYGPGVGGNFLRLLKIVDKRLPIPLAAVKNRRSMVSVWNLCDLIAHLLKSDQPGSQLVLVSDKERLSTPELVRAIGRGLDKPARLLWIPVFLLKLAGKAAGKKSEIDRLVGSLEIEVGSTAPDFTWSAPQSAIEGILATSRLWKQSSRHEPDLGRSHG